MNYWLMKSEGECYSIDDLKRDKVSEWTGVRNYQARNFMRDQMKIGDRVLFYHSNSKPSGVYGLAEVCSKPHPDSTQFDQSNVDQMGYDAKSTQENPLWICVDVKFVQKFSEPISLAQLKLDSRTASMLVCQKGSRLSVQPVSEIHYNYIVETYGN
jgi:predicted RNA-binding protein with PUA-like domain